MEMTAYSLDDIKTQLRRYIAENLLFSENGFQYNNDDSLLDEGIVDSVGVMELLAFLEQAFQVDVEDHEITPDNFDSVNRLTRYIAHKLNETP